MTALSSLPVNLHWVVLLILVSTSVMPFAMFDFCLSFFSAPFSIGTTAPSSHYLDLSSLHQVKEKHKIVKKAAFDSKVLHKSTLLLHVFV